MQARFFGKYIFCKNNHYFLVAKFFGVEKSFLKKTMVFFYCYSKGVNTKNTA